MDSKSVTFLLVAVAVFSPAVLSQGKKLPKEVAECFVSVGVKDPKLQEDYFNQPDNEFKGKDCFMMCLFKEDDFVKADGSINVNHIQTIFQQLDPPMKAKEVNEFIKKCQEYANKHSDKCKKAVEGTRCVLEPLQKAFSQSQG